MNGVFKASRCLHVLPLKEKLKISLYHKHCCDMAINTSKDVNSEFAEVKKQIRPRASLL